MESAQRNVLILVVYHLRQIGSANDAEDHGYHDEAQRLREESCGALRELADAYPFLDALLPALRKELTTSHILGFGWSLILDEVEDQLGKLEPGEPAG